MCKSTCDRHRQSRVQSSLFEISLVSSSSIEAFKTSSRHFALASPFDGLPAISCQLETEGEEPKRYHLHQSCLDDEAHPIDKPFHNATCHFCKKEVLPFEFSGFPQSERCVAAGNSLGLCLRDTPREAILLDEKGDSLKV